MAFKRLVGVIAIKDGQVVKSYGYRSWRPAGRLMTALRNLDRWLADEILILDISRRDYINLEAIEEIHRARISTPLTYGGGIFSAEDLDTLMAAGCERFIVERMLFRSPDQIFQLADKVGAQALIASLPLASRGNGRWQVDPNYAAHLGVATTDLDMDAICDRCNALPVSEVLVIDSENEGCAGQFSLYSEGDAFPLASLQKGIIWFGGIDERIAASLLKLPASVAVGIGHLNLEKELAIKRVRQYLLKNSCSGMVRRTH
jgi:imidazole glycerol-phosphate synthase subunit HisF